MAVYWVGHGHLEEKLAFTVQASNVHHHPPRPAQSALRKEIYFHGQDDKKKPYAATFVQAQQERGWELHVNSFIRTGYCAVTNQFRRAREAREKLTSTAQ